MLALLEVLMLAIGLYQWMVIFQAILSWLVAFNVVNTRNDFVNMVGTFLYRITEPALRPIRQIMPDLGGVDISPLVLILILIFLQRFIATSLVPLVV
ncbi:hypothetical protein CCR85_12260 [Rhodothalassium salexigens]|uniref:YggT family protein n=1 Tax=Rhodothalassium salexigens DSM 2132 TaxID=1188247 RepID=A0A4R2PKY5_RHOSA|nr:YggT family protein [Rhodothalassium salexigens]MBB4211114.1 YggT family protein [Rhodothalassium salexigens DSM 2132]MBK1637455.1 hypothetical protein [Rhodothalassium salexigens DSM 2132]MBK5912263.1 hypothetical protein [Rhodothalassium salexigens]MBK5921416.1 hypothetical protein [Rhodothalassium salexigens]TCP36230.1 YggT family protein [Rhodothalassium salexigens DSM 2132]